MSQVAEKQYRNVGQSSGCADHDHDLIHELDKRLNSVWRMDQYITNAGTRPHIKKFWEQLRDQEQGNIGKLKELVAREVRDDCF